MNLDKESHVITHLWKIRGDELIKRLIRMKLPVEPGERPGSFDFCHIRYQDGGMTYSKWLDTRTNQTKRWHILSKKMYTF